MDGEAMDTRGDMEESEVPPGWTCHVPASAVFQAAPNPYLNVPAARVVARPAAPAPPTAPGPPPAKRPCPEGTWSTRDNVFACLACGLRRGIDAAAAPSGCPRCDGQAFVKCSLGSAGVARSYRAV